MFIGPVLCLFYSNSDLVIFSSYVCFFSCAFTSAVMGINPFTDYIYIYIYVDVDEITLVWFGDNQLKIALF